MAFKDRFIYFPVRKLDSTPSDLGLDYQDIFFTTSDKHTLHGWFIPGPRPPTLLWFHGNAGNISHRLDNIAMIHKRLEVNIFIFDYRGYGESTGKPSEEGTYIDAHAALDQLRNMPAIIEDRIVLFGRSLGGAIAVDLASKDKVAGIILESTFTSIRSMAKRFYPFFPLGYLLRTSYNSLDKIGNISAPLLVIHGQEDEIVPHQEGLDLYQAASTPKQFYSISGAGHNDMYIRAGESYWQTLVEFLGNLSLYNEIN